MKATYELDLNKMVHRLSDGRRWVVAQWFEHANQWQAPMTARERHVTGCHTYFARRLDELGCTSYSSRSNAMRRARVLYLAQD